MTPNLPRKPGRCRQYVTGWMWNTLGSQPTMPKILPSLHTDAVSGGGVPTLQFHVQTSR